MLRILSLALIVFLPSVTWCQAEEPVFSGPQLGEKLPPFQTLGLFGEQEGKSLDLVEQADGGPLMIVFFHERTRPGFALMRAITLFGSERAEAGMKVGVVFLTDDSTETIKWASNVKQHLSEKVTYCVSPDGKEGPGPYGLNRNVTLTILVGTSGKVTANFALVQPQLQADGPAILKAIAAVTGGGEVPSMEALQTRYAGRMNMQRRGGDAGPAQRGGRGDADAQLATLLRSVINRQASEEDVRTAAFKVEAYVAENEAARKELARIVTTVVNSGKIENYGTPVAQGVLRTWLRKYGEGSNRDDAGDQDRREQNRDPQQNGDNNDEV